MAEQGFGPRDRMVERQVTARGIRDSRLLAALREVPRENFVPEELAEFAFADTALPIAEGQTISQPFIVALMIEAAAIQPGDRVLEIGAGSGYAAAVMSRLAGEVFAIERHKTLADSAQLRLARLGYRNVTVIAADGSGGWPDNAPFDAILVAARGPDVPQALKRQLAMGGRLIIPVGGDDIQSLCCITRVGDEEWTSHDLGQVRFVPLVGAHGLAEDGTRSRRNDAGARAAGQRKPAQDA